MHNVLVLIQKIENSSVFQQFEKQQAKNNLAYLIENYWNFIGK
jgi:hypothetical protein